MHPRHTRLVKILLGSVVGLCGILALIFVGFFVYYSWQFKFGDAEVLNKLDETFGEKFSATSDKQGATFVENTSSIIRPHNPIYGSSEPKITIIAFIDFECPYCQESYPIFKKISEKYNPVVRVIFKQLPLPALHAQAYNAAIASTCAQEQNKFWQYHDTLFETKQYDDDSLYNLAANIGLNLQSFNTCFNSQTYKNDIQKDVDDAVSIGVRGTPTYVVNGNIIEGVLSSQEWDTIILKHLN
ncbi:MAG TPA: hypothetical protein DCS29_01710 [Candidatus Magasanikbacteria bacterium]|nr:hypothetical protein [Candidatus Magasanikbacteria bacterium]